MRRTCGLALVNGLTLARLPAGVLLAVLFLSTSAFVGAAIAFLFLSDVLDGALARRLGVTTKIGGILDYVVDRFNYYLVMCLLVRAGVHPLAFLPFLIRDLVYVSAQVYILLPSIRGTKAASFVGTAATYLYLLLVNYWHLQKAAIDIALALALLGSLSNLLVRVFRLRHAILEEIQRDLDETGELRPDNDESLREWK